MRYRGIYPEVYCGQIPSADRKRPWFSGASDIGAVFSVLPYCGSYGDAVSEIVLGNAVGRSGKRNRRRNQNSGRSRQRKRYHWQRRKRIYWKCFWIRRSYRKWHSDPQNGYNASVDEWKSVWMGKDDIEKQSHIFSGMWRKNRQRCRSA